jgi:hypothetical protein
MNGTLGTHVGKGMWFYDGKPEGKRPLEKPGRRYRIILKWIFRKYGVGFDWIDLAQYRDRWLGLLYAVMNLRLT